MFRLRSAARRRRRVASTQATMIAAVRPGIIEDGTAGDNDHVGDRVR